MTFMLIFVIKLNVPQL